MNLAYETIFATFTGKGKLEHGASDKQLHFLSTLIRGEEGELPLIINYFYKRNCLKCIIFVVVTR